MTIAEWFAEYNKATGQARTGSTYEEMADALSLYKEAIEIHQTNLKRLADAALGFKPRLVDTVQLTEGQKEAICKLVEWLKNNNPFFLLTGYAGTGKSFVVSQFAKVLDPRTTIYTAPTNKATKVLKALLPDRTCKTIYSALGLRMVEKEDERVLTPSDEKVDLGSYSTIVVDESSMLNTELLQYILNAATTYGLKFLFVADPAQLPPVGEDISPVFALECNSAQLTEVVRHGSQILEIATHVRQHVLCNTKLKPIEFAEGQKRCVWRLSPSKFIDRLETCAYSDFEDTKCIAWRNSRVEELNAIIRNQLYTDKQLASSKWLVGDKIVFTEPVHSDDGKNFLAFTDDEGTVVRVSASTDPKTGLFVYFLHIKLEFGSTIRIRCMHEDSSDAFSERLSNLAYEARQPNKGRVWGAFWSLKNRYTNIRHAYAITAHRAQGSTFKTVFVDLGDVLTNSDRATALRCAYVAVTRASEKLYLTGFPV